MDINLPQTRDGNSKVLQGKANTIEHKRANSGTFCKTVPTSSSESAESYRETAPRPGELSAAAHEVRIIGTCQRFSVCA